MRYFITILFFNWSSIMKTLQHNFRTIPKTLSAIYQEFLHWGTMASPMTLKVDWETPIIHRWGGNRKAWKALPQFLLPSHPCYKQIMLELESRSSKPGLFTQCSRRGNVSCSLCARKHFSFYLTVPLGTGISLSHLLTYPKAGYGRGPPGSSKRALLD